MSETDGGSKRPFLDKVVPEAWRAVEAMSLTIREAAARRGLTAQESELIKLRASQLNGCVFCLDLHSRQARSAGLTQQILDLLPAWRESELFDSRQKAVLAVAEATTLFPLTESLEADLFSARVVLGDETYAAAAWVAVTINAFNRISVLSQHPVRPRDADGNLVR